MAMRDLFLAPPSPDCFPSVCFQVIEQYPLAFIMVIGDFHNISRERCSSLRPKSFEVKFKTPLILHGVFVDHVPKLAVLGYSHFHFLFCFLICAATENDAL